jgi:hypothetical protein
VRSPPSRHPTTAAFQPPIDATLELKGVASTA